MLINMICLVSIIILVMQIMIFFYMSALSDLKRKKVMPRRRSKVAYKENLKERKKVAK